MTDRVSFSPDVARRVLAATKYVEQRVMHPSPSVDAPRFISDSFRGESFWAMLVDTGPEGVQTQPDFNDARYWFRKIIIEDTGTPPLIFRLPADQAEEDEFGLWNFAYHLTEINTGVTNDGTHVLMNVTLDSPPRIAWVTAYGITKPNVATPEVTSFYSFETYPGQMGDNWGFNVSCLDGPNDCPVGVWVKQVGPGVISETQPPAC